MIQNVKQKITNFIIGFIIGIICFYLLLIGSQVKSDKLLGEGVQTGGANQNIEIRETKTQGTSGNLRSDGYVEQSKNTVNGKGDTSDKIHNSQSKELSNEIKEKLIEFGVDKTYIEPILTIGKEFGIHPYYFAIIGSAENIRNPRAIGDNGCSLGAYQFNKCAGNRKKQIWYGRTFEVCIKDPRCSTKMLAEKIRSAYKCEVVTGGYIPKFYECLPLHNGYNYRQWYVDKLVKANSILFN